MDTANSRKTTEKYKEEKNWYPTWEKERNHINSQFKLEKLCHVITNQKKARVWKLILGKSRVQTRKAIRDKMGIVQWKIGPSSKNT